MNNIKELLAESKMMVGPGWWPILDKYLPWIAEVAPGCEIEVQEKYGSLQIYTFCEPKDRAKVIPLEDAACVASSEICEQCGAPGTLRTDRIWYQTLCDRCE